MKVNNYPDGSSYVGETKLGEQVFRVNTYEDLWHLNQFVDAFHSKYSTKISRIRPDIVIPNLLDAQADRRFNRGESSGLKLVCKFLNNLEANFEIFHPHNAEVVEAMMDNVEIIDNSEFIVRVLNQLNANPTTEKLSNGRIDKTILMSSDAGGFKPLMRLCDQIYWEGETYSASKARTKNGMRQLVDRQDFGGKDILIVDDISVYGGTFKGLSKLLRERNCGKLYLAVSHMTVQDLGADPVTDYFDKVFTTNSKFDKYYATDQCGTVTISDLDNLEIINLF